MLEKKIGRPKKYPNGFENCSFKLPKELYPLFKDFALASGESMSDLVAEFVKGIVDANAQMIEDYRARKSSAVKATFATPEPSKPAQVDESVTSDADAVKDGDDNENS